VTLHPPGFAPTAASAARKPARQIDPRGAQIDDDLSRLGALKKPAGLTTTSSTISPDGGDGNTTSDAFAMKPSWPKMSVGFAPLC